MKKIEIRPNGTRRVYTEFTAPSKTQQQFKDDCDVNKILEKYMKTGEVTHLSGRAGQYGDVSEVPDLLTAHIQLQEAAETFASLPAKLRKRLNNDPLQLESYLKDPDNLEEAMKFGLITRGDDPKNNLPNPQDELQGKDLGNQGEPSNKTQ